MHKRLVTLFLALGLVATACGDDDENEAGQGTGTSAPAEQPVRGGTFVVGVTSLPDIALNPAVNTQGGLQSVAGLLYNGLVEIDQNADPVPELATRWDVRENGKVYEFTLAQGVKWHDGRPLTAADVKFSFEVLIRNHSRTQTSVGPALEQPCTTGEAPLNCPSITATEASGGTPARVTFRFANPYAPLLRQLTHNEAPIIPKHLWDGKPAPTTATPLPEGQNPVGTGPFRFVSRTPNELVYERNPEYFRPELPLFDRVVHRVTAAGRQDLETGAIDWLGSVPGVDLPPLRANPDVKIDTGFLSPGGSGNCLLTVVLNLHREGESPAAIRAGTAAAHPMLGDVNVRRAVAAALNRPTYVRDVQQDDGSRLANGPIHSNIAWASSPNPLPNYDVREADRLLTAAGWTRPGGSGTRVYTGPDAGQPGKPAADQRFEIDYSGFAGTQIDLGNKLKQDLAAVGIELTVNTATAAQMNTLYSGRNYDTLAFSNCQQTDPEIGVRRLYHSASITGAPFTNGAGYRNQAVDNAFDQAAQKVNQAERSPLYAQASAQIARDLPYLYLLETASNRAFRAQCHGLKTYTSHFAETGFCRR